MGRAIVIACAVLLAAGAGCAETPEDSATVEKPTTTEAERPETTTTSRPRPTTTTTSTTTTSTTTTTTAPPTTTTAPPPPPTTTAPPPPPTTAAPVAPAAGGGCTPGYDPCVPVASDVDCAGGSGDGPAYVDGPISVTGSDPYGLDSDGDGVGCQS